LAVTINPNLAIPINGTTPPTIPNGTVETPYSQTIELADGMAPFHWSIYNGPSADGAEVGGALPDGLTLDSSTGTISGTPSAVGSWYFEVTVTDAEGGVFDAFLSIQINPAGPTKANPVPFLNQPLVPTSVLPGGPGFTLHVSGTGFVSGASLDWNGAPLTTMFVDSKHLSALLPEASVATAQTASVTVVNPAPSGGSSNVVYFQVGAPETAVSFANAPNSPLQFVEVFGITAADLNQTGKPDLAVAEGAGLDVLLGNGDGTFSVASGSPEEVLSPPFSILPLVSTPVFGPMTVGDFTHSGHAGLAVAEWTDGAVMILVGNGNGTLDPSSAVFANANGIYTSGVEAADFNADGNLDLAMVNSPNGQLGLVALGYGSGAFNSAGTLYTPGFPAGVAVGDFNGDGKLDAAVAGGGSTKYPDSGVAISLGNGDGTFTQANGSPISLGQNLSAIVVADFNGDGKLDIAVTDADANAVRILLGNGDGTFQSPITIPVGSNPQAITVGDFNDDGKLDIAVANNGDDTVTLLLGNGDGTFTEAPSSPYTVGKGPIAIAAADFNGDGKLDMAVANGDDGTVSILLQQ
jgi:hypothetical protein